MDSSAATTNTNPITVAYHTFHKKIRSILHSYREDATSIIEAIDQKIVEDMKNKIQTG